MPSPIVLLFLAVTAVASPADSRCSCGSITPFEQVAASSPIVIVIRAAARGPEPQNQLIRGETDPRFVDVEVVGQIKGTVVPAPLRIWNPWAGSSCGGLFASLTRGMRAVVAVEPVAEAAKTSAKLWTILKFSPGSEDYVVDKTCAEPMRLLRTDADVARYLGKPIR